DLPHKLVEAFEATLQEANDADLLLHVVDCASPHFDEQIAEVERVLAEIGAAEIAQVLVFNQVDRLEPTQRPRLMRDQVELASGRRVTRVFVSAVTGEGFDALRGVLAEAVHGVPVDVLKQTHAAPSVCATSEIEARLPEGVPAEPLPTGTYHSRA
ncbi:MAG TPA: hypothetical protein VF319_11215, partial [Caldimonas sp.]